MAALEAEGYTVITADPEQFRDYHQRLAASGFTAEEREAAAIAGLDGESLELLRQRRIARDPATLTDNILELWSEAAAGLRAAGEAVLDPPAYGQGSVGGVGLASLTADHKLFWMAEASATVQVGNPAPSGPRWSCGCARSTCRLAGW